MKAKTNIPLILSGLAAVSVSSASAATLAYWQTVSGGGSTVVDIAGGDNNLTGGTGLVADTTSVAPNPVPNPDAATTGTTGSIGFGSATVALSTNAIPFYLTSTSSFTFEGWFLHNISDGTQSGIEVIGGDRQGATSPSTFKGWYLNMNGGQVQFFYADPGGAFYAASSGATLPSTRYDDGAAHHFAAVWNHTNLTMSLYMDGGLVDSDVVSSVASYTSPGFTLGGRSSTSANNNFDDNIFKGSLDEVRFSNEALAPSAFLAVPEPSSTLLMGLGGLAFVLRRRRSI